MHRYRKTYRISSLVLLVCLFSTLGGISAASGHDCCGNCVQASQPDTMLTATVMVSSNCCPTEPACACTLQSTDDRALPVYSLVRVSTTGDSQATGQVATRPGTLAAPDNRPSAVSYRLPGSQPDSEPLYLTYQSFLC